MSSDATTDRERFWGAVNEALDGGMDPLGVPLVQEWVADNPADGDELARLLQRVETVARARKTAPRKVALAAAAFVLVGAAITLIAVRSSTHPPAAPPRESRSCVLEFKLEVVREGGDSSSTVLVEPGRVARSHTALLGATTIVSSLEGRSP